MTPPIADERTRDFQSELRREFQDEEYRYAYAEDFLNTWVATQIVTLREQRGLSQTTLGELIGTKQPGVSRLEDVNHSTWRTDTLKKIARALKVRLKITFETFGTLLDEDDNFNRSYLERPTFADDPAFQDKPQIRTTERIVKSARHANARNVYARRKHGMAHSRLPSRKPSGKAESVATQLVANMPRSASLGVLPIDNHNNNSTNYSPVWSGNNYGAGYPQTGVGLHGRR